MKLLPRSIFGRLVVVQITIAVALAALLPLLISYLLISTTNAFVGHELDRSASLLRGRIAYGSQGWMFTSPAPRMFDARAGIRNARLIDLSRRTWIDQGPQYGIPLAELPLRSSHAHRLWNGIDVATYPIESRAHRAWLVISSDRRRPESLVANVASTFLERFLWIVPALIFCSLGVTLLFLSQAARAIRSASRRADAIAAESLDVRLNIDALPVEVQSLARAMNQALDRVQDSYASQAEFAANVAHEIRNPLATIMCRIEEIPDPSLRRRMSASVDHAVHVVDQLMMLARLGGGEVALSEIDLRAAAFEVVQHSAAHVIAGGRTIELCDAAPGKSLNVKGNEGLTRLSLENLIDNAQRHTPPGTHIRLDVGPGPRLFVHDDGPGISGDDRLRVAQRHWRGSNCATDGAGLGLSIVDKAMRAQNGSLEICESGQGARVALLFNP